MLDLTDALRRSLTDHATDAPGVAGLDTRVYARSRRLAWRQRGLVAAAAALVVAVAVPAAVLVLPDTRTDREPPAAALEKDPGATVLPARVTYLPPLAAGLVPTMSVSAGRVDLDYRTPGRGESVIVVSVQTADPRTYRATKIIKEVAVNGVQADLIEWGSDVLMMAWQRTPGAWTMVWAYKAAAAPTPVDEALLRPIAEGLTDGTTAGSVPFTLDLIPRGFVIGDLKSTAMRLCPTACAPERNRSTDILIELTPLRDDIPLPPGAQVAVGSRTVQVTRHAFGRDLYVPVGDGRVLVVAVPEENPLSDKDLATFAAGITVTPNGQYIGG